MKFKKNKQQTIRGSAATSVLSVKVLLKATSSLSSLTLRKILHLSLVVRRCPSSFSALGQQADEKKAAVGCQSCSK